MLIEAWGYAFLFVVLSSFSVLGYSRLLERGLPSLPRVIVPVLALGLLTSVFILLGLMHAFKGMVIVPILFIGLLFFRFDFERIRGFKFERTDYLWLFFPVLYFTTRFFSAGLPQQHNDALYYHLAAAKFWVQEGTVRIPFEHASFAQATLFEALYSVPMFFLGTNGVFSHVVTQVYGQWMHMLWGHLGCILIACAFLKKWISEENSRPSFLFFISWMLVTIPSVEWTGGLAKNDFIVALFVFSAIYAALLKNARITGVFAGFAFSSKMSAIGSLLALPILFAGPGFVCELLKYSTFGIAATLTILLRNLISTGAPFFPMFDGRFGATPVLAQWWVMHNASFAGPPKFQVEMFSWIWLKLMEKALPKVLFVVSLLGFFLRRPKDSKTIVFAITQLLLILSTLRSGADGRYAAYALSFLFLVCFGALFSRPMSPRVKRVLPVLVLLGLSLNAPVDLFFKIPMRYWFSTASKYVDQYHAYQNMKNWINENTPQDAVVIAIADKANFYLDRKYETFTEMKSWEDLTTASNDAKDFLRKAKEAGARYILIQTHFVYPPGLARFWDELMQLSREKSIHEADNLILVDLDK